MQNSELNPCCAKPSIQSMDYRYPVFADFEQQVTKVNRICLHCFAHWFGVDGEVKQYTRKEWDAWIESSLSDEVGHAYHASILISGCLTVEPDAAQANVHNAATINASNEGPELATVTLD